MQMRCQRRPRGDMVERAEVGRVVAALAPEHADEALRRWRELPEGREAACIGVVEPGRMPVVLRTALGGLRVLEELEHDALPRIC